MVEHTEDTIQIDLNVFKNSLSSFENKSNERLDMKKKEILKIKCFSGDIHEKKYVKHDREKKSINYKFYQEMQTCCIWFYS